MPGHKGKGELGFEKYDITEFSGADSLLNPEGIIAESEKNASKLFGCRTLYSTEGSSHCIRAMVWLTVRLAAGKGVRPVIAAGRNAHSTLLNAAAVLGAEIVWIAPDEDESYLSCRVTAEKLERIFAASRVKPTAVYITSPDYLGNVTDIASLAPVCKKYGAILAVDNAHGAYLKFHPETVFPIDAGADICCDSAHKTLPVITGGAYLHISPSAPEVLKNEARLALNLFGTTSPSYLILSSLAAYPLARMSFGGKKIFFFAILATIMIPFQAIMLPVYIITLKLHLIDSVSNVAGYLGLVMPFAVSAFGIFLMRQAFLKIPREVEEAAIVDGCNVFQMFVRVVLPMVKPTLAVLAVFTFIGSWGEFLWPSIMLTKESMYTLPVGINNLQGMFSANWRYIAAGSIISTVPIIIFFLAMQRYFISGENDGAVKG